MLSLLLCCYLGRPRSKEREERWVWEGTEADATGSWLRHDQSLDPLEPSMDKRALASGGRHGATDVRQLTARSQHTSSIDSASQ